MIQNGAPREDDPPNLQIIVVAVGAIVAILVLTVIFANRKRYGAVILAKLNNYLI